MLNCMGGSLHTWVTNPTNSGKDGSVRLAYGENGGTRFEITSVKFAAG